MVLSKLSIIAAALALSGLGAAQSSTATESIASETESSSIQSSATTDSITSSSAAPTSGATTTVSVIDMFPGGGSLFGSVMHAGNDATTYHVDCVETKTKGGKAEECGVFTIEQGPETFGFYGLVGNKTSAAQCVVASSTVATCTTSIVDDGKTAASTTMTATLTGTDVSYTPIAITAGAGLLNTGATLSGSRWVVGGAVVMAAAVFAAEFQV